MFSPGLPRGDGDLAGAQTNTRHGGQEHLHQQGGLRVHQLQGGHGVQRGGGGDRAGLDPPQPDCGHQAASLSQGRGLYGHLSRLGQLRVLLSLRGLLQHHPLPLDGVQETRARLQHLQHQQPTRHPRVRIHPVQLRGGRGGLPCSEEDAVWR